jgi:hypothetical protein
VKETNQRIGAKDVEVLRTLKSQWRMLRDAEWETSPRSDTERLLRNPPSMPPAPAEDQEPLPGAAEHALEKVTAAFDDFKQTLHPVDAGERLQKFWDIIDRGQ